MYDFSEVAFLSLLSDLCQQDFISFSFWKSVLTVHTGPCKPEGGWGRDSAELGSVREPFPQSLLVKELSKHVILEISCERWKWIDY